MHRLPGGQSRAGFIQFKAVAAVPIHLGVFDRRPDVTDAALVHADAVLVRDGQPVALDRASVDPQHDPGVRSGQVIDVQPQERVVDDCPASRNT